MKLPSARSDDSEGAASRRWTGASLDDLTRRLDPAARTQAGTAAAQYERALGDLARRADESIALSIQLPFLLESAIASAAGALLACAGLALGKFYLIDKVLKPNFQISRYIGWDSVWSASVVVVVVSIGISSLASLIVLRRYLRV